MTEKPNVGVNMKKKSFIFRYIYLTYFFRFKIKNLKLDKKKD